MSWTGNDSPLPFAILFSLRSHLFANRGMAAFAVGAIAASVALATSLEVATRSVQAELKLTADALAGAAKLEVSGGALGVREAALEKVARARGVAAVSPLMQKTFQIVDGPAAGYPLRVLGVDFLSDRKVRGYSISEGGLQVADPLRLMSDAGAIILTQRLAERLAIEEGETLRVRAGDSLHELTVRGLLLPGGVADAYGGQVAAMDVYALQEMLGRRGWFDRIDVVIEEAAAPDEVKEAIEAELGGVAAVRRAATRGELAESAFGTISLGIWIFACIGVVVAGFLSYGTMSLSVDWRANEFALLQLAGLEPAKLRRVVYVDGLIVAILGTLLGLFAGVAASGSFLSVFSGFVLQLEGVEPERTELAGSTLLVALAVGLVVSTIATLEPAHRATSRPALQVLRESSRQPALPTWSRGRIGVLLLALGLLALGSSSGTELPATVRLALFYGASLVILIGLLGPSFRSVLAQLSPLIERGVPGIGLLIGSGLLARPTHTALTVAGLAVTSAGLVAALTVIGSTTVSISDWIASRYPGGTLVSAGDIFISTIQRLDELPSSSVDEIRRIAGDGPIVETYSSTILYQEREILIIARSFGVMADRGHVPAIGQDSASAARALHRGGVAVSEAFSRTFQVEPGDALSLVTPRGIEDFPVVAMVRDYAAGANGALYIDVDLFDRHWERSGAQMIAVWPASLDDFERRVRLSLGERHAVFITPADEYAQYASRMFDRFSGLVYGVIALVSVLGAVAVMNLVFGGVIERRRELSLLRSTGATSLQLVGMVLADALLVSLFGSCAGLVLGVLSADQMFSILTESLGWTVDRGTDWALLGAIGSSITLLGVIGCVLPAWIAVRIPGAGAVRR